MVQENIKLNLSLRNIKKKKFMFLLFYRVSRWLYKISWWNYSIGK